MPRLFKTLLLVLASLFVAVSTASAASAWEPYDAARFSRAQEAGRTIVVDVHATWCPVCKAQAPTLEALPGEPRLKDAVFVRVDFDTEKAFLRRHKIPRQSTVLVFKGKRETARSISETRPDKLRAAVFAGL